MKNWDNWMDWSEEDEELLDEDEILDEEYEEGVIEYEYGIDENDLRKKLAPKNVESPAEFSKTPVIKLQNLINQKIEGLVVGLTAPKENPKAQFFYTIKYWWIGKDPQTQKTIKRLVSWEVRGPTSAYYIKIPTEHIVGIYQNKGYHMSSDIFIEYRIDERKSNLLGKWVERRDAFATWKKPEENIEKEFRKIQEGKPSSIAGSQPVPEDKGPLGFGELFKDIQKTLMLLIVLSIIIGGIYFTAKLGILDMIKDLVKPKK